MKTKRIIWVIRRQLSICSARLGVSKGKTMKMKCTYRLLVLLGAVSCLLVLLGITGDVSRILDFGKCSSVSSQNFSFSHPLLPGFAYNATSVNPTSSSIATTDVQHLVSRWKAAAVGQRNGEGKITRYGDVYEFRETSLTSVWHKKVLSSVNLSKIQITHLVLMPINKLCVECESPCIKLAKIEFS